MDFKINHIHSTPSTNEVAVQLIADKNAEEGIVITTSNQTRGKGQGTNGWESEEGQNLTMSLILKPQFLEPADQFFLTKVISLALQETVQKYLPDNQIRIKWPNDLYCEDKKLAGVLIQNFLKGNILEFTIVGIGLNINQLKFVSDAPNPVSMAQVTQKRFDLEEVKNALLENIGFCYEEAKNEVGRAKLTDLYMKHLYQYQLQAKYEDSKGVFLGKIVDINAFGQLIIQDNEGKKRIYDFKEVAFLHN